MCTDVDMHKCLHTRTQIQIEICKGNRLTLIFAFVHMYTGDTQHRTVNSGCWPAFVHSSVC